MTPDRCERRTITPNHAARRKTRRKTQRTAQKRRRLLATREQCPFLVKGHCGPLDKWAFPNPLLPDPHTLPSLPFLVPRFSAPLMLCSTQLQHGTATECTDDQLRAAESAPFHQNLTQQHPAKRTALGPRWRSMGVSWGCVLEEMKRLQPISTE